jgi:hypothetical protein
MVETESLKTKGNKIQINIMETHRKLKKSNKVQLFK